MRDTKGMKDGPMRDSEGYARNMEQEKEKVC